MKCLLSSILLALSLMSPLAPALATDNEAITLNNEGVNALKDNDIDKAIEKFKAALAKSNGYGLAVENLSIAYNNFGIKNQKDLTKSLAAFHMACWLSPSNKTCFENLDNSIKASGKNPASFADRIALAEQALKQNDFAAAIVEYQQALKIKDDANAKKALTEIKIPPEWQNVEAPAGQAKPTVYAEKDVDFGPYMADMQRRVKKHWFPPKEKESLKVRVVWKIHADGTATDIRLDKPAGEEAADKAAISAVENASPFRPLPDGAPAVVDIQFTFDYNVFSSDPEKDYKARLARAEKAKITEDIVHVLWDYAQFCQDKDRRDEAKKLYKRAIDTFSANELDDDGFKAGICSKLGDMHYEDSEYKDANLCYQKTYDIRATGHPDTATYAKACRDLGYSLVYMEPGPEDAISQARDLFNKALLALEKMKARNGSLQATDKELIIEIKYGQAHCSWRDGDYAAALPLYQWVLDQTQQQKDADKAKLIQRIKDVADCNYQLEKYAEALPLYRRAVALSEQNPDTNQEDEINEAKARVDELCAKLDVPTDAQIAQEKETKKSINKAYSWLPYALGGSLLALLIMYMFGQRQNNSLDIAGKSSSKKDS